MPVVSTLHTVLQEPTRDQRKVLLTIAELSSRRVVMSKKSRELLMSVYGVPEEKIRFVHHGIPDMPFVKTSVYKKRFGVQTKKVMLTFGLLSPNKGIEVMIRALPAIVEKNPDAVYIVVGATHPHVKLHSGEEYRQGLERLRNRRGKNIIFTIALSSSRNSAIFSARPMSMWAVSPRAQAVRYTRLCDGRGQTGCIHSVLVRRRNARG